MVLVEEDTVCINIVKSCTKRCDILIKFSLQIETYDKIKPYSTHLEKG